MLQLRDRPVGRAVRGGSARYLERLIAPLRDRIRLQTPALEAQAERSAVSGRHHTHSCGAYRGHGFHEDGVRSALAVGAVLGVDS